MTKYTADDFANARFAEHPDGGCGHRVGGNKWRLSASASEFSAGQLAIDGWVPVPTKPAITESQYRLALDEDRDPQYVYGFTAAMRLFGGEVIPDPEPTNKEKWVAFLLKVNPDSIMIDDYAEAIVAAGVTPPEDNA